MTLEFTDSYIDSLDSISEYQGVERPGFLTSGFLP